LNADGPGVGAASGIGTAEGLRRLFDESFAAPAESKSERSEDLLAIRVGSDPYALRLSEIAGLHADLKIVQVPSPAVQLLGIASVRGVMAPIYDLGMLLGYLPAPSPRWIVFARAPQSVGFAFETFESHVKVSQASLARAQGEEAQRVPTGRHLRDSVRTAGALRPIIHLTSVVAMLGDRTHDR
jgi:chemotaxis signal transduction protein